MSRTDIFVSYSREDRAKARLVAQCLEREGLTVWWDVGLQSGESFDLVIERHLSEAKAVVVLWSPRSAASRWVRAEASNADKAGKLAPVIIEPCVRPIIFELLHTIDLCHWDGDIHDETWRAFVEDLLRNVRRTPVPLVEERPSPDAELRPATKDIASADADDCEDDEEMWEATQFFVTERDADESAHYLHLIVDDRVEKQFPVGPNGCEVGRSAPADIILTDRQVSRRHCRIERSGDELLVVDLGSTNGTFIDGQKVTDKTEFPVGSTLTVGPCKLLHQLR